MAKSILVANWKNHPASRQEAEALAKGLSKNRLLYKKLSLFIAPPLPYLGLVSERTGSFARLASQDLFSELKGTYTGEVLPEILKSYGVRLAILGHSERRALGESSEDVAAKVEAALRSGITPLVCIGEKTRDTDGEHFEFLRDQLKSSLAGLNAKSAGTLVVAYEPSWAIGKSAKDALPPAELTQSVIFIRKVLTDLFGRTLAEKIPILYGGSIEPANAMAQVEGTGVRGFLVGHASLKPKDFETIASALIL